MLTWLNPFKWWRRFQLRRRWQAAHRQFINAYHQHNFTTAESAGKSMVELANRLGGRKLLASYHALMLCYQQSDRLDEAIECEERVLDLQQSLSNSEDPAIPARMCELADLLQQQGRSDEAIGLYGQALTIRKRIDAGKGSIESIQILEQLAAIYIVGENGDLAEKLIERARGYREKLGLVKDANSDKLERGLETVKARHRGEHLANLERFESLNNEAFKYYQAGEIARSIPIAETALSLARKIFPKLNNDLATSLNNLASFYQLQGRWTEAEPLYDEALSIYRHLFGTAPNNDLATSLNNLAGLYASQGRWTEAEPLYDEALSIRRHLFGTAPNNDLATSLNNLAGLYASQGRWTEAVLLYDEALSIYRHLFGKTGHPDLVTSQNNFAAASAEYGDLQKALTLFQEAIAFENQWLKNIVATTDRQQRLKDLERRQVNIERLLALTQQRFSHDRTAVTATFNAILSRKAQAATAEANFSQALRYQPHLAPQIEAYQACQQEIANLAYALGNQPELADRFDRLFKQHSKLEKKLARSIPELALVQQPLDLQVLKQLLPDRACIIEFVRYHDYDFGERKWQPARYLAFIVRSDRTGVEAIDCGLAAPLDLAIDKFRRSHTDPVNIQHSSMRNAAKRQIENVGTVAVAPPQPTIDPILTDFLARLLPHLPPIGTCYLAPDSHLHILPFHLLPTGEGEYLGDRFSIHYIATARDLYRQNYPTSTNPALILADPDYDGGLGISPASNPKTGAQYSDRLEGEAFERLPINQILGDKIARAYGVKCYRDIEATVGLLERVDAPPFVTS